MLESSGHLVIEARSGQQALDLLVASPEPRVGMIILDLQMPVMDGWQFLRLLSSSDVRLAHIPAAW